MNHLIGQVFLVLSVYFIFRKQDQNLAGPGTSNHLVANSTG